MVGGVYPEIIPLDSKWAVWLCAALSTSLEEVFCPMHQWLLFWGTLDLVIVNSDITRGVSFFLFGFGLFPSFHIALHLEFNVINSCVLPTE